MLVVFGSLNADLISRVARLPAPGETVLCESYVVRPGGKGNNQAVAAARAGASVRLFGRVGRDDFGAMLVANLSAHGVDAAGVVAGQAPTGCAAITVDDGGENVIVVAAGANLEARAADVPVDALSPGATLVLQMEVPPAENWRLLERARAAGARTVINVAPASALPAADAARLAGTIDVLVANADEAVSVAAALGVAAGAGAPDGLARRLAGRLGATCVITLGADGAVAADGTTTWRVHALSARVVDSTGAGDTFIGVMAAALDRGLALRDALHRAAVAGALACEAVGAQESMPTKAAIEARLGDLDPPEASR